MIPVNSTFHLLLANTVDQCRILFYKKIKCYSSALLRVLGKFVTRNSICCDQCIDVSVIYYCSLCFYTVTLCVRAFVTLNKKFTYLLVGQLMSKTGLPTLLTSVLCFCLSISCTLVFSFRRLCYLGITNNNMPDLRYHPVPQYLPEIGEVACWCRNTLGRRTCQWDTILARKRPAVYDQHFLFISLDRHRRCFSQQRPAAFSESLYGMATVTRDSQSVRVVCSRPRLRITTRV